MLALIPRYPARKSTSQIARELEAAEMGVSKRTVERDLERLADLFLYTSDEEVRTLYWFYPPGARILQIPAMTPDTALVLRLTQRLLTNLLPRQTLDHLADFFVNAQAALEEHAGGRLKRWDQRVVAIDHSMPMAVPEIHESVRACIYDAVLKEEQVRAWYKARGRTQPAEYRLHPVGLVIRDGVTYLVAMVNDYTDLRHLALHRMVAAEPMHEPARPVPDLDFESYVEVSFAYPLNPEPIQLEVGIDEGLAAHLTERPLSGDQEISEDENKSGRYRVTATVADNEQLRWWLAGLGATVEVLGPPELRAEFRQHATDLARLYLDH